jgi:hypothetical protein
MIHGWERSDQVWTNQRIYRKKSLKKDRNPLIFYSYAVSMSLSLVGREG